MIRNKLVVDSLCLGHTVYELCGVLFVCVYLIGIIQHFSGMLHVSGLDLDCDEVR